MKTIWAASIASCHSAPVDGEQIVTTFAGGGIPITTTVLKRQHSLGAWAMDCACTEARDLWSKTPQAAQYYGVPNNTYALLELSNPPEEFPAVSEQGKGNIFEAYATCALLLNTERATNTLRSIIWAMIMAERNIPQLASQPAWLKGPRIWRVTSCPSTQASVSLAWRRP